MFFIIEVDTIKRDVSVSEIYEVLTKAGFNVNVSYLTLKEVERWRRRSS